LHGAATDLLQVLVVGDLVWVWGDGGVNEQHTLQCLG
jgi:hypothetical protein